MGSVCKGHENFDAGKQLQAQSHVWNQMLGFVGSASLRSAVQLGIPDVIRDHGRPMTVPELARALQVPSEKSHSVFRLMRIHTHSGFRGDDECVKILKGCNEPISKRRNKGKLILIDMVVGNANADEKKMESRLCFDLLMMALISGKERTEIEWAKLFNDAGFSGYKISPLNLGLRSI